LCAALAACLCTFGAFTFFGLATWTFLGFFAFFALAGVTVEPEPESEPVSPSDPVPVDPVEPVPVEPVEPVPVDPVDPPPVPVGTGELSWMKVLPLPESMS